jgi:hypothetical protein
LLARGEALERRIGTGNPPTEAERAAFGASEERWRLECTYWWEHFKKNPPDQARATFDELLHADRYGMRLAQIREHLGG